jgi:hypothetical protein
VSRPTHTAQKTQKNPAQLTELRGVFSYAALPDTSLGGALCTSKNICKVVGTRREYIALQTAANRAGSFATRTAGRTEAHPRAIAVAGAYDGGCAVWWLLARHVYIHRLIISHRVLRDHLLLRAVGPLLGDTLRDGPGRLLALSNGLHASRRLSSAGRNCHGQSD